MTDQATAVILINSNSAEAQSTVALDGVYRTADSCFGNATVTLDGDTLKVSVPARESAIIRLER
jgi:hypothetical protein